MTRPKAGMADPKRTAHPGIRTKIYVQNDMIGAGKIDLLRSIRDEGSITRGAARMGMSYRRAWFLLDTIQRCFAEPLLHTQRGGANSGARLTPLGEDLIRRYDAHIATVEAASAEFLEWLESHQADKEDSPAESA